MLATQMIHGTTLSDAWLNTVRAVDEAPARTLYHLVTRIERPVEEVDEIRAAIDWLLGNDDYPPVDTVANTIFPAAIASTSSDHVELVERYTSMYPTLRRLHRNNRYGTYFGRIVAHPTPKGDNNQLAELIRRLNTELKTPGPKSARYEMSISSPGDAEPSAEAIHVYSVGRDNSAMGFPCLSFCSFQLDHDSLHLVAHYRRQHLIERGYGNYLGLGRLLEYVCAATRLRLGQLTVVAGVASVEPARYKIAELVSRAARTD
ncbi:hypothetical protein Aple_060320 [Acrocarpospora pleiomorpha]|uniref:Thymidylate synthase n=1 Tax=Acrocarpospora pleiomorpha TaxID=90975 RepID=A0A5M3XUZ9_9ACTN|nr:hypothetical protein [Acrocarpospora pleiomorpha]GES23133.1 hypothetical protein Aple_060320 [Acrocarpospora pleiomorpha]